MIDLNNNRLKVNMRLGVTKGINSTDGKTKEIVFKMTNKRGVNTTIEAVGIPATFELFQQIIAPGGSIDNASMHGVKVDFHLEKLWDRNISISTQSVDTVTIPTLFKMIASIKIDSKLLIMRHFKLYNILKVYDTFLKAAKLNALKVIIEV